MLLYMMRFLNQRDTIKPPLGTCVWLTSNWETTLCPFSEVIPVKTTVDFGISGLNVTSIELPLIVPGGGRNPEIIEPFTNLIVFNVANADIGELRLSAGNA